MKQQINEFKRMQLIAGVITESEYRESLLNEDSLEKTISFGPYTNLTYYDHPREDTAYLVVDTSDNFTKIARAVDTKGKDFYTKKQILYLNDKLEDLADEMSDYLTKQGIENEVVDSPEGYGQEIDNLEIEISKDDLSKLRMTESQTDEAVSYYGDINNLDKPGSPEKEEAMAYLETPEGMNAVNILKNLVNSESFDLNELGRAIKKCDFKKTNHFRVAAKKAGLDLEGLGTLDNSGNGDFAVRNRNYKDKGYAVVFFNDKFERVG
jgi:hypothetical protein